MVLMAKGWWTSTSGWLWLSRIRKADKWFVYLNEGGVTHGILLKEHKTRSTLIMILHGKCTLGL